MTAPAPRRASAAWLLALLTLLPAGAGCRGKAPEPVPVKGRVRRADGGPLAGLLVRFHPQDEGNKHGRVLSRPLDERGEFQGECLPGRYKVTLAAVALGSPAAAGGNPGAGPPRPSAANIPPAYADSARTPWEVTIPPQGADDLVLSLK